MRTYSKTKDNLMHLKSLMNFRREKTEVILASSSQRQHCMCNSYLTWLPKISTASVKVVNVTVTKLMLPTEKKSLKAIGFLQMPS